MAPDVRHHKPESSQQLSILNPKPSRLKGPSLLHQLARPASAKENAALDYLASDGSRTTWSYKQLHQASDELAARISAALPELSNQQPLVIPVLIPQCPELYIAQLAILKAGGAFCPLNLDAPPERVKFILQDVAAHLAVTTHELLPKLLGHRGIEILIVDDTAPQGQGSLFKTVRQAKASDLAYVMYTSGSTGTPKGVGISHGAATQALLAHDRHVPEFSRFLQFAAPTFDVSVFEIFFPLFRGSTLVCCSRAEMLNDLPSVLKRMEVDSCELTPTVAGSLLRNRENAPGLRLLLTIGEMLTQPVIEEFGGNSEQPSILWAMYGPTEATIHCTLQPSFSNTSIVGNVGFPLDTVSAYILQTPDLEDQGQQNGVRPNHPQVLPRGEVGELAIGGHQLATGYINRPEQTASAFIDTEYGRLYRTGDKARLRLDGTLECLGRISEGQVKLRGQRIELGEVEQVALRTSGCHGAVAAVIGGILVVFCEVDQFNGMEEQIKGNCQSWLPRFMVPGDIRLVQQFPRLPSGKVDRKTLAKDNEILNKTSKAPASTQENDDPGRQLREIAEEILVGSVDATATLSALGMDSLQAIRFASRLREVGFQVSAVDVLNCRTLGHLRKSLASPNKAHQQPMTGRKSSHTTVLEASEIAMNTPILGKWLEDIDAVLDCTPLQSSMLVETSINPQLYFNWVELDFSSECSVDEIGLAFQRVIENNEIFRTGFTHSKRGFVQVIWRNRTDAQIRYVETFDRQSCLDSDESLLHPFDVQLMELSTGKIRALIRLHHSLYDGWSLDLMLMDLDASLKGNHMPRRPQFRQLMEWQQSAHSSVALKEAQKFWAESLLGYQTTPTPALVTTKNMDQPNEILSVKADLHLDPLKLKQLSRDLGIGPQAVFHGALIWLWSLFVGRSDVAIGTVNSGRTNGFDGIERVMGPCLETVPLRCDISHARVIKELLEAVHTFNRAQLRHSFMPLTEINRAAEILPGQALYNILFVYQESLYSSDQEGKLVSEVEHRDYLETKILLEIEPNRESFVCRVTHHSESWSTPQVRLFVEHFRYIVGHMIEHYDEELNSLRDALPARITSSHNIKPTSLVGCPDIARLVDNTASRIPDKVAIRFAHTISEDGIESEALTYKTLSNKSNQISRYLREQGTVEGEVVAIVMEKSTLLYTCILGIVKAGCAYLPLLPSTPPERKATIFEQANVRFCLTDSSSSETITPQICEVLDMQSIDLIDYPETSIKTREDGSRTANVIHTSGSTGVPKGVCVTHLNIASNLDVLSRIYPVGEGSNLLQSCSQAFDVSVFEIFFAWTQGMCLCSAVNDVLFEDLERAIHKLGITHLSMTPTVAALVDPAQVPNVKFLVTSGEPMTEKVAKMWSKHLYQGYGPSETTNICTVKKMSSGDAIRHLGHAFGNTSSFVLHPRSVDAVPLGCVGELCFGGDQITAGYLNMPAATSEKFLTHANYGRIYRSGDIGRMLPDGSLMIIGRLDDQIKIRGQRVELSEIDSVVRQTTKASAALTLLVTSRDKLNNQLVSFYVPSSVTPSTFAIVGLDTIPGRQPQCIFQILRTKLPSYMIPAYLVPISAVPLTSSGKADKTRLRNVFKKLTQKYLGSVSDRVDKVETTTQWTSSELSIAAAISEVLDVNRRSIGRWTPFPSLGLDSISAIRFARHFRRRLKRPLAISVILQNPSVAQLAEVVASESPEETKIQSLNIFSTNFLADIRQRLKPSNLAVEKVLPCTPLQEAMLASRADQGSYINRMLFRLKISSHQMKEHWLALCERHGILRTCFVTTENTQYSIAQVVLRGWSPEWQEMKASNTLLEGCVLKQVGLLPAAIDSFRPPLSFATIQAGYSETYLSFVCHHALYDGEAIARLIWEAEQLTYGVQLPPAPLYEELLEHALCILPSTDEFWKVHLESFRPTLLQPSDDMDQTQHTLTRRLKMPLSETEHRMQTLGCSMLALCQASWACVVGTLFRNDDICFGNVVSGRSIAIERIEELVAPCFNTIPLRVDLSQSRHGFDILKTLQDLNPEMLKHQFTPLRRIQKHHGSSRIFDTLLLLQQPSRHLDSSIWTLEQDTSEMDFPLVCEIIPSPKENNLEIRLHHYRRYVSTTDLRTIFDVFAHAYDTLIRFPYSSIHSRDRLPIDLKVRIDALELRFDTPENYFLPPQASYDRPWTDAEATIRSILSQLSAVPEQDIKHTTTIYQLGLDSISAVQVAAHLRRRGLEVTATQVMEYIRCEDLAKFLDSRGRQSPTRTSYNISAFEKSVTPLFDTRRVQDKIDTILPCTPLQCGMLSEYIRSSGDSYFNFVGFEVDTNVSAGDLDEAWNHVVVTNPMLRTGFVPVDHKDTSFAMVQYPASKHSHQVRVIQTEDSDDFVLGKWRVDTKREVFEDLGHPPWRVVIVALPEKLRMHLAIHHGLYDAYSLQNILDRVAGFLQGQPTKEIGDTQSAVVEIFSSITKISSDASEFWARQAARVVINKFPILTPLKVNNGIVHVESTRSSLSFSDVEQAVRDAGLTVQAVLQAAWARLLSSYLGETSVTFGVVLSGRNNEATLNASFPCITTLPVIAKHCSSNRELVEDMLHYSTSIRKYQHMPLLQIQKWLGQSESRLFDTLLVYQKMGDSERTDYPWEVIADDATVEYPVSMEVEPRGEHLDFRLTFYDDVIALGQAKLLLSQFDAILRHMALHPDQTENDLFAEAPGLFSITPAAEPKLQSRVKLLHEFVEIQATTQPDKTAVEFVTAFDRHGPISRKWTYRELDTNATKVAALIAAHAPPRSIVAICFEKCPEVYFSILGILKSGCSFVALDPGAPHARKEFIVRDSGATIILVDESCAPDFDSSINTPIITISESVINQYGTEKLDISRSVSPSDTCYCLYTSGTTGTPKGCEITHENAVQAMLAFQKLFAGQWDQSSRWLQFASLHFDVSVLEQYWTWSVGITLVAAPRDLILEDLAGTISRLGITHIDLTPSLARLLDPADVPSLCRGVFITGGEELKQEILDTWGPTGVIHNFYGPTEATIGVTTFPHVPQNGRSSNIGRQFPNVGTYVFRPGTDLPVFKGAVGELCISGCLVGKGYLNRHELTKERFPTLQRFDERVYRTGDLVRLLHDGCFDFLGRADDQVKLRGQRLEIGEINHAIKQEVPEVIDVATVVIRNEKQGKDFLVSFVVVTEHQKSGDAPRVIFDDKANDLAAQIQNSCRSRLPRYMVPTYVLQVTFIPLSTNNKVEVRDLKTLFNSVSNEDLLAASRSVTTQLSNELTKQLISKMSRAFRSMELLDEDDTITTDTSIFDLGIDSITVLRLSRALKREGFYATPTLILQNPVISHLIQALDKRSAARGSDSTLEARLCVDACRHQNLGHVCESLGVDPEDIEYIAPCSALQHGMISRSRIEEHRNAYFNTFYFQLDDDTDVDRLREAWQSVVHECAILRTRFVQTRDGFVQVALKMIHLPWSEVKIPKHADFSNVSSQHRGRWLEANQETISRPMELVLATYQGRNTLLLNMFHGLYDAMSLKLLLESVSRQYNGRPHSNEAPNFIDAMIHGPLKNYAKSRGFWEKHLTGVLFQPFPRLAQSSPENDPLVTRTLPFAAMEPLRKSLNVTHSAIVQALWVSVLGEIYHGEVTIGLIVSGRSFDMADADKVVGPLFNTLPFHVKAVAGETWASLVRRSNDFNASVLQFQQVSLRDIQKWCSGGKPLFDTLFSFHIQKAVRDSLPRPWEQTETEPNVDYPLALESTLKDDNSLELTLIARREVADEPALLRILAGFESALQDMLSNPQGHIIKTVNGTTDEMGMVNGHHVAEDGDAASPDTTDYPVFVWNDVARCLAEEIAILAEVSSDQIGEKTSLLELGLDSIDTIKLSARLKTRGINLTNSQLIRGQSIVALLGMLNSCQEYDDRHDDQEDVHVDTISANLKENLTKEGLDLTDVEKFLPPTPLQEALVAEMVQSEFRRYFNHDILRIAPGVNIEKLREAWINVVRVNPILRTGFVPVESPHFEFAYCQLVFNKPDIAFSEINLEHADDISSVIEKARVKAKCNGGRSNLFQLVFACVGGDWYAILSMAHALYDGWSLSLLHEQVRTAYRGQLPSAQEPYDAYLKQIIRSVGPTADRFWSSYLSGAQCTLLQERDSATEQKSVHRSEAASSLSPTRVRDFCRQQRVSLQVVGQFCWAAALSSLVRSLDVTFGAVLSGRDSEDAEKLVVPTMNTVPIRVIVHGTVSHVLRYMQENMAEINHFQHYPLRKAQRIVNTNGKGIFNTLFILQHSPVSRNSNDNSDIMKSVQGISDVEYPLCAEMEVVSDSLKWRSASDEAYLTKKDSIKFLQKVDAVLSFLLSNASADVLTVDDGGVSVCGLPAFTPVQANEAESIQSHMHDVKETSENTEWSHTERIIKAVLSQISGVTESSISKAHNIYSLGLDSISAIKASSTLKKRGMSLSVRQMLKATSIEDMARLANHEWQEDESVQDFDTVISKFFAETDAVALIEQAGISPVNVEHILPATAMQVHMISVWQNTKGRVFFPEFRYILRAEFDVENFRSAWETLVRESQILRTNFVATGSSKHPIFQVVAKASFNSVNCRTREIGRRLVEFAADVPGLQQFATVRCEEKGAECLVTLKIHHALYDGVSLPLLVQRFAQLCSGSEKSIYTDQLASWKNFLASQHSETAEVARREFWTHYLKDLSLRKSLWRPNPKQQTVTGQRIADVKHRALPDASRLRLTASTYDVSVQSLFFAACARVLGTVDCSTNTSTGDVVFGIYLANRSDEELRDVSYPTLRVVPLVVRDAANRQLPELARTIQADLDMISTPANSGVGLWEIKDWTGVEIDSFVNFLSLPGESDEPGLPGVIDEVLERKYLLDPEEGAPVDPGMYKTLENNVAKSAYPDAVDIEVALRDGALDIGIFAAESKCDQERLSNLLASIVSVLRDVE